MTSPTFEADARRLELSLTFSVPSTPELMQLLVERAMEEKVKEEHVHMLGPVVTPDRLAVGIATMQKDMIVVLLTSREKPSSEPPAELLAASAKVGGAEGLQGAVNTAASSVTAPPIAELSAVFRLDATRWRGPVPRRAHHEADAAIAGLGKAEVEEVGYRFTNAVEGLLEVAVIYDHRKKPFYKISMRSVAPMQAVGANLIMPGHAEACNLVLAHLFSEQVVAP